MVMKPSPPIWTKNNITTCPNVVKSVAMVLTTSPVTQVALVAVNRASTNDSEPGAVVDHGSISSAAPIMMTAKKLSMINLIGVKMRSAICLNPNLPFIQPLCDSSRIIHHTRSKGNDLTAHQF